MFQDSTSPLGLWTKMFMIRYVWEHFIPGPAWSFVGCFSILSSLRNSSVKKSIHLYLVQHFPTSFDCELYEHYKNSLWKMLVLITQLSFQCLPFNYSAVCTCKVEVWSNYLGQLWLTSFLPWRVYIMRTNYFRCFFACSLLWNI